MTLTMSRKTVHFLVLAAFVASLATTFLWLFFTPSGQTYYYTKFRGAEKLVAIRERREDFKQIWLSLSRYKELKGQFPDNVEQWSGVDPAVHDLLKEPSWAESGYTIFFEVLNRDEQLLLIPDPGLQIPGADLVTPSQAALGKIGFGLFNDGTVAYYDDDEFEQAKKVVMKQE